MSTENEYTNGNKKGERARCLVQRGDHNATNVTKKGLDSQQYKPHLGYKSILQVLTRHSEIHKTFRL